MPESIPSRIPPESSTSPTRIPHPPPPRIRKTRFVCISDTHNASAPSSFQLPRGDVLLHAGDLTNQGSISELRKTLQWIEDADFEAKIIVAASSPSILYLSHSAAEINLSSPPGPHTTFRIFGSPFPPTSSPSKSSPYSAFTYPSSSSPTPLWNTIPLDTDILITHTPPHTHLDARSDAQPIGCEDLRKALWRVRPRLALCGHVHEGRGAEVVRWDLDVEGKEESVRGWEDPGRGNKKMSIVDLSARAGFENDGVGVGDWDREEGESSDGVQVVVDGGADLDSDAKPRQRDKYRLRRSIAHINPHPSIPTSSTSTSPPPSSSPSDPLSNRLGRKETCIVNAAIMGRSWPHSGARGRGKTFNKPIVVDIELPVWE
ncbi:calcineurin-like phosphoesterase protein [Rutstroemia sp. NJR-2017a WRK4]|nr:calcineurin-like phosphoesterase protein [Rutstroemia sp. NJR-2017a WRK4]